MSSGKKMMEWSSQAGDAGAVYASFLVPPTFAPFAEDVLDVVGLERGTAVLDVACGTGALSRAIARRVGPQGRVTAVDLSPAMLAVASAETPAADSAPIDFIAASADDLPVAPGTYAEGRQPWRVMATAFGAHIGPEAGERMLSPFGLSDLGELRGLVEGAGFAEASARKLTREVTFTPRDGFARRLIMASPLAQTFLDTSAEQQAAVLDDATRELRAFDGGEDEIRFELTTNLVIASVSAA
jgi:hypothetical protein